MDLMFLAENADQEATKEANRLQDMQRAPSHSEDSLFDNRVDQRRVWMAKNEVALQSRLRYQEAVEALHRVQAEWGPFLGLEVSVGTSPRTVSSKLSNLPRATSSEGIEGGGVHDSTTTGYGAGGTASSRAAIRNETICLWVIGVITVNVSGETLGRAYYGSFSEAATVPSSGWMAFDEGSGGITVSSVAPKKALHKRKQPGVDTWVVDGAPFPEVNGRYMERGVYGGVPRYRNTNNIFLFRHTLGRSEDLGITRQTCLPESELVGEDIESAATTAALSLGREVSGKIGMDFSRLVKTSLQSINLDRQERVRLNHQRIARAVARVDSQFQQQMSQASATLDGVERAESGGDGDGGSSVSSVARGAEKNRDLAVMAASDGAKLTFQEHIGDEDRVIPCEEHGVAPLCKRWVARACPKNQIQCRCRHYFISIAEKDGMVAWREGRRSRAELEVLACIAKRETLLFEAEKEGIACRRRFLSETRTKVDEDDVAGILNLLDQLRLASVRVVEAICRWREDIQAARMASSPLCDDGGGEGEAPGNTIINGVEHHPDASLSQQQLEGGGSIGVGVGDPTNCSGNDQAKLFDDKIFSSAQTRKRPGKLNSVGGGAGGSGKLESNTVERGREVGRGAKGRWVATMMVPGRKLWDSSPAMVSQYKRFRRSRQDPKIARDQLYLGVFATKNEAMEAYDDALRREAVKQRSSVLRMPKKRIVTRTCGKHMAVQSDDTPAGRPCEQCAAEALNGGVKHSPPYIWNNSNYLLKMTEDLSFLAEVDPLVTWLGARESGGSDGDGGGGGFDLKNNPFLLADPEEDEDEDVKEELQDLENRDVRSNALSVTSTGSSTPPATEPTSHSAVNSRAAALPSTAPSSLLGLSSLRERSRSGEDVVLPTSPQQQQRLRRTPGSTPPDSCNPNCYIEDDDDETDPRASCTISAVSTPRAAWAKEGDAILDDVFGGSSQADGQGFDASGSHTFQDGAELSLGEGGLVNESSMVPTMAGVIFHGDARQADGLGGSRCLDVSVAHPPRRAAFGKPSTKIGVSQGQHVDTAIVGTSPAGGADGRAESKRSAPAGVGPGGMNEIREAHAVATGRAVTAGSGQATHAAAPAAVGAAGKGRGMRDVMAVYRHRGAQLVLEQSRKRHPFRMDGVFCRQDRGEWSGQVHMSVNAKKFVARRLLDKILERRNEQRGRIGRMMHKLIEQGQPIHRLAGPRLRVLLSKARGLGGDRLTIDIMEAEAVLRLFNRVEKSATIIQAVVRGVFGREDSKRFVAMKRKEARLKRISMTAAGAVAEEVVEDVLQGASRRARRFIRRPVTASVGVFQDGRKMIVSAVPLEQRSVAGSAPKATTERAQLCSACQGRSAHRVLSCKNNAEEIFRGVCSCYTVRPPESVRLTAYDPVSGEQVCMTISGKHLTEYLLNKRATEGVEGQSAASPSNGNGASPSTARKHVLAAARLLPLPWDAALGYGNPKREAGTVLRRFWEPYHEARKVQKMAEGARMDHLQLREASLVADEAAVKAAFVEEAARAQHETWQMNAEHVAGRRRDLVLKFLSECEKSREALAFSRRSVQQMEDRDAEDWTQGWDPFENGNNWRQLIKRRSTDRALTSSTQASLFARDAVYRAREERAASKHWANEASAKAERARKALEKGVMVADDLGKQAEEARSAANEALKLLAFLSRPTVKAAGRLQKRLVIEEGGHDREQWDALFRGGMVLETPELSYVNAQDKRRRFCVATVRRDARTGTVVVTAAGEDKAVNLYSVTMSAAEVMSVVSEKVGGRRGTELVSPIVMEGAYAATRRVQEARRKEILQVLVESLKLDIYQNELAVGKLFFIRRSIELKSRLLETLWHRDAVARRSSGRGTEILRQFHRLGSGWAPVTVYETWGHLFFEAYDSGTASTMTLQTSLREVLESLSRDRAAAAAFLYAVRTGTFPRKLVLQILNRLDVHLPGERGQWWRRPIDGETPHLVLLRGGTSSGSSSNASQPYRGPIWTEERFSSGKPVTAGVFVSARGDYLVQMEARDPKKQTQQRGVVGVEHKFASSAPDKFVCMAGARGVLRLEVRASELRAVFRGLDKRQNLRQAGSLEGLLAPDFRVELCRYLLEHIAIEDVRPTTNTSGGNSAGTGSAAGVTTEDNKGIDVELQEAYKGYQAWAAATKAPVDPDPLRETQHPDQPHERQHHTETGLPLLSPSEFSLVLRPDIGSDEHLLPIHESPWTPDGKVWFQAKISLPQDGLPSAVAAAPVGGSVTTAGFVSRRDGDQRREGKKVADQELGRGTGLSVTLRPEGAGQRRVRLEREAAAAMALEDERSRQVGEGMSRLEKEAAGRLKVVEENRCAASLAAAVFTAKTRIHNRVRALLQEEHSLTKGWAEHDLKSARETAWEILPLLRLEASQSKDGGQSASRLRIMDTNAKSQGDTGSHFLRRLHVLENPVEMEQVATTTRLTSGSWREAIGELVGCPLGQELRALNVNGPLVFALHSTCPATFNVKAQKLLGISVQGDVVWVQARAEDQVIALLEADRQLTGQESEAVTQLGSKQEGKVEFEQQRSRRYDGAVTKEARRLLPAFSRAFFSTSVNSEDKAAAEVRSLLDKAWLSSTSDLFDDPFKGVSGPDLDAGSGLAAATSTTSASARDDAFNDSIAQVQIRPWHVAKDLLKMHVLSCKVPGPACPVPCCRQSRMRASTLLDNDGEATLTSVQGNADADGGADAVLLRELDRCIMWYWESKEYKRRGAQKDKAHQPPTDIANEEKEEQEEQEKGESSERQPPFEKPRLQPAAGGAGGESANSPEKRQPPCRSRSRPFQQALQALSRLTAAAGKPHDGVSTAVYSFSSLSSVTTGCGGIGREVAQTKAALVPRRPSAPSTDGSSNNRRGELGGRGGGDLSSPTGERCRVDFDMIRLLTGPDGNDAGGRPVGVRPGDDVKAAVLSGSHSQMSRWVMSRLRMNTIGGGRATAAEEKEEKHEQEALCLDERHATGGVCISGTRFLLTISQLLDGSLFVAGHDPTTCQTATLTLGLPAAKTLCLSERLEMGSTGKPIGSVVAKHLMRNAARLLEVQTVGGVEALAVAGYHRADNESLASSTSSGAALPAGFRIESRTGSPRQLQLMDLADDAGNGKPTAGPAEGLHHKMPPMTVDETRLMECRIRRLEVGRRRAERTRRVASSRRVAKVASEQRKMLLTCDAEALASSKSSFEALLLVTQGMAPESPNSGSLEMAAGLEKAHVLALRDRVMLDCSGGNSNERSEKRRGSIEVVVETFRRGSVQLRRRSVQLVAEVRERTLKRPVSPAGSGDCNDVGKRPLHVDDAGDAKGAEEIKHEVDDNKEDGVGLLAPLDTKDDAGAPPVQIGTGVKQDKARGEREEEEENADGAGTIGSSLLAQRSEAPGKVAAKEGTPREKQQPEQQQQRRQRPVTRSPRNDGLDEGAESSSRLEGLLSAVAGLTQRVEEEGGLMGATAYAAWWLGALSAAELELKKRFLTPGPKGSLRWGKEVL
eukprot:g8573.t1